MAGIYLVLLAVTLGHLAEGQAVLNPCQEYFKSFSGRAPIYLARDCDQVRDLGGGVDGVYMIFPDGAGNDCKPAPVYCDQTQDGGGWTVLQRRKFGKDNFNRTWDEYKRGFGYLHGEHWLGNDMIHRITMQGTYELQIELEDFQDHKLKALYFPFGISDEETNFTLGLGVMESGASVVGDSLSGHNGQPFSTWDRDNDAWPAGNCAMEYSGGWWFRNCHKSNLNGIYHLGPGAPFGKGVIWSTWKNFEYSLYATVMKIRRRAPQVP
ncbi:Microfibril-associated glycoprotein 4 [Holothuria leucospilota]|uniref:Microfibril-associated glycoprotein 4 n=1 Tax=Holothuria leucospilota TaxID=206669 RepID=A0A9Q1BED1_HOLLE|nr:Microfibril-associated glycoprotein 4 [Holothuria leucospilota]